MTTAAAPPAVAPARLSAVRLPGLRGRHVGLVLALGSGAVVLSLLAPRVLGRAVDVVFAGVVGERLPAGTTTAEAVTTLEARGDTTTAHVVERLAVVPGHGVDLARLGEVLLLALGLYAVSALLLLTLGRTVTRIAQRTVAGLREEVTAKLARLPLRYFDAQPHGQLLSRTTDDVDAVARAIEQPQQFTSVLTVLGALVMMLVVSPTLTLVIVVTVPLVLLVAGRVLARAQRHAVEQKQYAGMLFSHVEEQYSGHVDVRLAGWPDADEETFRTCNDHLYRSASRAAVLTSTLRPLTLFLNSLVFVLIAVAGLLLIAAGSLSLGDVQAFLLYAALFSRPLTFLAEMAQQLQAGLASAARVAALLDEDEEEPDPPRPARWDTTVRGRVEFDDVWFSYDEQVPVLRGLSFSAEPGTTVAVVGPTGAGKTTVVNLLMRFYEPQSGRITLDGVDVATATRGALRSQVGMVLQDVWLFEGTIAENIAFGVPDATRDDVVAAARAAHLDSMIRALPAGYDTVIREDVLSDGERQLVTVARAFLVDPAVLVLDEATSAVDTRTEVLIQRATSRLRDGRTSVVIAHRLSTIRDADLILVLYDGRIAERGDHDTLLAAGGLYTQLHAANAGGVLDDDDLAELPTALS